MATTSCPAPTRAHLTLVPSPSARKAGLDLPAVIAGSVDLLKLSEALTRAGLCGRYDGDRELIVIEPAVPRPVIPLPRRGAQADEDASTGMRWYNALSRCERARWHEVAGSAAPADCWRAFQSGFPPP